MIGETAAPCKTARNPGRRGYRPGPTGRAAYFTRALRLPISFSRSAFSRMKPAASFWS